MLARITRIKSCEREKESQKIEESYLWVTMSAIACTNLLLAHEEKPDVGK
jgi:hypothetical protein